MTWKAGIRHSKLPRLEMLVRARISRVLDRNDAGEVEGTDRIRALVSSQRERWLRLREKGILTADELRNLELATWRFVRGEIVRRQLSEWEKDRAAAQEQRHREKLRRRLAQLGYAPDLFDRKDGGETICVLPQCHQCGKSPLDCSCRKS